MISFIFKYTTPAAAADSLSILGRGQEQMTAPVPRGRVVWDTSRNEAVIYISSGLYIPENIERIVHAFGLENVGYRIVYDEHYQFAFRIDSASLAGQNPVHHAV